MADPRLLRALAATTVNIRPGTDPNAGPEALDAARFLMAVGLKADSARGATLPDAPAISDEAAEIASGFFDASPPAAISGLVRAGARAVVFDGTAPSPLPLIPGGVAAVEQPSRTLGPFRGAFDQPVWIQVVTPIARLVVRVTGDPAPVALFGSARLIESPFPGVPARLQIDPGTA